MRRAVGYIRVSTTDQAKDGVSLDTQSARIEAWASFNGYVLATVHRDAGLSGKRWDNRPGLASAMQDLGPGDALVCYSLSRLSRSTRDMIDIAERIHRKSADLVSLNERVDTSTAAGAMIFRMLAVLNEFERDQVAERTRHALRYKRDRGEKTGGEVPYGFLRGPAGILLENPEEQEGLRLMTGLEESGLPLRAICRELTARGFRTKMGRVNWHPQTVKQILASRRASA